MDFSLYFLKIVMGIFIDKSLSLKSTELRDKKRHRLITLLLIITSITLTHFVWAQESSPTPETLSYADEMAFYRDALGISGELAKTFDKAFSAWNARDLTQADAIFAELDKQVSDKLANVKAYLYLNRGLLEVDQKQFEKALSYYEQAKKLVPEWWLIDAHIAEVHALEQGNSDVIETVKLEPYQASFYFPLSFIFYALALMSALFIFLQPKLRWVSGIMVLLMGGLGFFLPSNTLSLPNPFSKQSIPEEIKAKLVLDQVLSNTYRAFIFQNEEEIYDALALSVTGDELRDIYLQNRSSVKIQAAGDATMRIDNVEIKDIKDLKPSDKGGFEAHTTWQVSGFVRHFGHLHYRLNGYEAIIRLIPENGVWKIETISLISQTQVI